MEFAEKVRGEGKLGATDAQGTRTYFKEGVGWVTELGERPKELEDYFYTQELPELRGKFKRDNERGLAAEDVAGQLLGEFKRVMKEDPKAIEDLLYSISSREIGKNTGDILGQASTDAMRTGSMGGYEAAARGAQRAGADARVKAGQDAKLQSLDYVDDKYTSERSGLSQLYNLFAGLAGQSLQPSMQPGSGPQAATALMNQFAQNASGGNSGMANAIGRQGGTIQSTEPNMAEANMWGGIGQSVAGLGERIGSMGERSEMNDMLKNYITQGGQLNLNSGGIMDLMTERVKAGGGVY
jgi:hypothetical protein